jgi:L-fuconolactonase
MEALKRDHLPDDLAPLLGAAGLEGSVAVQARQTVEETRWLLQLACRDATIKGVVGWVDLCSPDVGQDLERLAVDRKLKGVRHVVQDEPDEEFMLRPSFLRGLSLLATFGLTYDLLVLPRHLSAACRVAERFPKQRFVLDHIAKPPIRAGWLEPWTTDVRRLAAFSNVACKVSGLVTEADWQGWRAYDFVPYLDVVFEAFGPGRIMFGSDWPVCTLVADYQQVAGIVAGYVASLSPAEQAAVWGETAASFYGLE